MRPLMRAPRTGGLSINYTLQYRKIMRNGAILSLLLSSVWIAAGPDVLITEFQALNNHTVTDKDGQYPDWFELYNAGDAPADLSGWFATDDPGDLTKWRFPAVTLPPGAFLLVFASNKDLRDPAGELHTNFRLSSRGEYLGLVAPDGKTVVWDYGPQYPPQPADFSYGLPMGGTYQRFVQPGASVRVLVPQDGSLGTSWTDPDFNDSSWRSGTTAVGYDRNPDYRPLIGTNVESDMYGEQTSVYVRIAFNVEDPDDFEGLTLKIRYDDGFVAYLNGVRIAADRAPQNLSWNSAATDDHPDSEALSPQSYDLTNVRSLLRPGKNVLAIHGLNRSTSSSDFLILPELEGYGGTGELDRTKRVFFDQPTPGFSNVGGYVSIAERPSIEPEPGVFIGSITVRITVSDPGTEIRYTTDGSVPSASSPLYTGPFTVSTSTLVRARGFAENKVASPTVSAGYVALASDVRNFSSDLPVIVIENFGRGRPPKDPKQPAFMAIFEPHGQTGRALLSVAPDLQNRIGIEVRGSSTAGRPKPSFTLEAWDEDNEDFNIRPLGMPEESDWILYGPYNFDLALMRNHFIYHLSNEVGRYAVRSKFCEVFFNMDGGSLSYSDYLGVYCFMEKIKRGDRRVDISPLPGDADQEPEITGGYMLKIDRADPGEPGFSTQRQGSIRYVYPKERALTTVQKNWIRGYLQEFENVLFGPNFRDPVNGYRAYVDVDSWIDHHILNVLAMNVDALRLSTFFYKDRGGKIEYGPIWDFDRSMGSTDGRDDNPRQWNGTGDSSKFFDYDSRFPWWNRLFQDPDFYQRWIDRWFMFRKDQLSTTHMHQLIDGFAEELSEAYVRNFQRWSNLMSPSRWPGEVRNLKNWLAVRASWIDSQFLAPPRFSAPGGKVDPGFEVAITASSGTVYYTLDGSDPRASGGSVAPQARRYTGPIVIEQNVRVVARAMTSQSRWSAPAVETYVIAPSPLVITEIMYHPADGPPGSPYEDNDYEFIEFFNRSDRIVDLTGVRVTEGVQFAFAEGTVLQPHGYGVLVRNLEAFRSRYPNWRNINILGQYTGSLQNRGEDIVVEGPMGEILIELTYRDAWYLQTDGGGWSLCLVNPFDPTDPWSERSSWQPSVVLYGTPGAPNDQTGAGWQRPGDINQDGRFDISDCVGYLRFLLGSVTSPLPCEGSDIGEGANLQLLDLNGDGRVNLADPVYGLSFLFAAGPPPVLGVQCVPIEGCPHACTF